MADALELYHTHIHIQATYCLSSLHTVFKRRRQANLQISSHLNTTNKASKKCQTASVALA